MSQPSYTVDLIPGALTASVYERALDAVPDGRIWLFNSHGLESFGQRELILATRRTREDGGRPPDFPLLLFNTVHRLAAGGSHVEEGDHTVLQSPAEFGGARIGGFAYHSSAYHQDLPRPDRGGGQMSDTPRPARLLVLPLLPDEMTAAVSFGHARVLALLGQQARRFPFPWWFDATRRPVVEIEPYRRATILSRVPVLHAPYLEIVYSGTRVELRLPAEEAARLPEILRTGPDVFALLPRLAGAVQRTFVWQPEQRRPTAVSAGSGQGGVPVVRGDDVYGLNFLIIAHGRLDPLARLMEDGFSLVLPDRMWHQLLDALQAGEPSTWILPGPDARELALVMQARDHVSPFGTYRTDGVFQTFAPDPFASGATRRELLNVEVVGLTLLSSEQEIAEATTAEALAGYVRDAEQVIDDALDGVEHGCTDMLVEFRLEPDRPPYASLAIRPDAMPEATGQVIVDRLNALPAPKVRKREVRFQLTMRFPSGSPDRPT
jgi:hypothetical protein